MATNVRKYRSETRDSLIMKVGVLITDYNRYFNYGQENCDKALDINDDIREKLSVLNGIVKKEAYQKLADSDDPMMSAILAKEYVQFRVKDYKGTNDEFPHRELCAFNKRIDIAELDRFCHGIGYDPDWYKKVQKLGYMLTTGKASAYGSAKLSEIVESFNITDEAKKERVSNPNSKTGALKALTQVVQAMIGPDYKPLSFHVTYLRDCYTRYEASNTIGCVTNDKLAMIMADICYSILTKTKVEIGKYDKKKEKKSR